MSSGLHRLYFEIVTHYLDPKEEIWTRFVVLQRHFGSTWKKPTSVVGERSDHVCESVHY